MKRIYFVRHGETIANVESKVQGLDDPLTPEGELQAIRKSAKTPRSISKCNRPRANDGGVCVWGC